MISKTQTLATIATIVFTASSAALFSSTNAKFNDIWSTDKANSKETEGHTRKFLYAHPLHGAHRFGIPKYVEGHSTRWLNKADSELLRNTLHDAGVYKSDGSWRWAPGAYGSRRDENEKTANYIASNVRCFESPLRCQIENRPVDEETAKELLEMLKRNHAIPKKDGVNPSGEVAAMYKVVCENVEGKVKPGLCRFEAPNHGQLFTEQMPPAKKPEERDGFPPSNEYSRYASSSDSHYLFNLLNKAGVRDYANYSNPRDLRTWRISCEEHGTLYCSIGSNQDTLKGQEARKLLDVLRKYGAVQDPDPSKARYNTWGHLSDVICKNYPEPGTTHYTGYTCRFEIPKGIRDEEQLKTDLATLKPGSEEHFDALRRKLVSQDFRQKDTRWPNIFSWNGHCSPSVLGA